MLPHFLIAIGWQFFPYVIGCQLLYSHVQILPTEVSINVFSSSNLSLGAEKLGEMHSACSIEWFNSEGLLTLGDLGNRDSDQTLVWDQLDPYSGILS